MSLSSGGMKRWKHLTRFQTTLIWCLEEWRLFLFYKPLIYVSCIFRCCCGQDRTTHCIVPGIDIGIAGDIWLPNKHTRSHPTDAYGTIEFQGSAHPTKAQVPFSFSFAVEFWWINFVLQYVRLSYDTRPELIVQLFTKEWNLELPKLLLTVQGGKANFELQSKLKKVKIELRLPILWSLPVFWKSFLSFCKLKAFNRFPRF